LPSWFGDHIAAAREGSPGDALEWDQYQQRLSPISAQSRRIYEHRHKALLSYRTAGGKLTLLTSKTRQRDKRRLCGLLVVALLVLGIAALVKYLTSERERGASTA